MNLDALVAPLRADVVSGAAAVSRTAAEVVRRVSVRAPAGDVAALRSVVADLGCRVLDAQPAMAPLVTLVARVLNALDDVDDLDEARRVAAHAAQAFREELDERVERVARRAARMLPGDVRVVTLSASSTVRAALLAARERHSIQAVVLESRPVGEGQSLARALAQQGLAVTFAVDAAAERLLPGSDAVLMGADSIGDRGVVNKIGSVALARAARARDVPVWVLADSSKLLPPGFPQPVDDDRPPDEVWRAPPGVGVWNRYFEQIPDELVDRVVTEECAEPPASIHADRAELPVPPELLDWSRRNGGGNPGRAPV